MQKPPQQQQSSPPKQAVSAAPNGLLRTPLPKKCMLPTQAETYVSLVARPTVREGHCQASGLIRAEREAPEYEVREIRNVWQCFY